MMQFVLEIVSGLAWPPAIRGSDVLCFNHSSIVRRFYVRLDEVLHCCASQEVGCGGSLEWHFTLRQTSAQSGSSH